MMAQADTKLIRPRIRVLTKEQRERIHADSLHILSEVGIKVASQSARRVFARAVGRRHVRGEVVRIPREVVEHALKVRARSFHIYDRRGNPAFRLPGGCRFGMGVTALYYQDPGTGRMDPFTRPHMEACMRLGQTLEHFDFIATPGILQDVPPERADMAAALHMVANAEKPLALLVSDDHALVPVLDMLEGVHGSLAAKPFVIPFLTPITPLVMDAGTTDRMEVVIKRGVPFIYLSYGMAGASTPLHPLGALALLNAELLAGLTLSQLLREGAPLIAGLVSAFMDMKGAGNFYDVASYTTDLAVAELMASYGLPYVGTSGSAMGYGADIIAAGHQWLNHVLRVLGRGGLAAFVGDIFGGKVFSPALAVLANEVIAQARRLATGIEMAESRVVLQEIAEVGPGGNFLSSDLTFARFRDAYFQSRVFPNWTLEEWEAAGRPQASDLLHRHTERLLAGLQPPSDRAEILEQGRAFMERLHPAFEPAA